MADGDVLFDEGLEEGAGPARVVEDQRAGDLDLAHGELVEVAGGAVGLGEGCRDQRDGPLEEVLDIGWPEAVADGLEARLISARGEAVLQLDEGQAFLGGLALGPLVRVGPGRVADLSDGRLPARSSEPDVRLSPHPALHEPCAADYASGPLPAVYHGEGMRVPR